ncbi:MAG: VacJ family lipoprotein [Polaromonas sp.]|nr:MAG: VacJ family lipoprotein [Polaromonas sp.]
MITRMNLKTLFSAAAVCFALLLQGCATGPSAIPSNPADPLEPLNRTVFQFNDQLDRAIIKPVALAYRDVTPSLVRRGVTNFFNNIADVWSLANNVLQLQGADAADMLFRVTVNTFWGLGGVLDVASEMNIPRHTEDFGQTLGRWGVAAGPYVVLPILGPSTVRDSVGTLVDLNGNLVSRSGDVPVRNSLNALGIVNLRANFLATGDVLDAAALDKYTFTREIYLQRRRSLIDREAPEKEERFDLPETLPETVPAGVLAPATAVDGASPTPVKAP